MKHGLTFVYQSEIQSDFDVFFFFFFVFLLLRYRLFCYLRYIFIVTTEYFYKTLVFFV